MGTKYFTNVHRGHEANAQDYVVELWRSKLGIVLVFILLNDDTLVKRLGGGKAQWGISHRINRNQTFYNYERQ